MKKTLLLVLIMIPIQILAGDYNLYIAVNNLNVCDEKKLELNKESCHSSSGQAFCTVDSVTKDLNLYFLGEDNTIPILVSAFTNGRVTFCSSDAKNTISKVFMQIKQKGINHRGRHLDDFIAVNGL